MTRGLTRCLALVEEAFEDKRHRCPNFSLCLLNPSTRFLRSSLTESRLHKLMAITRHTNRCACRERWRLSRLPACSIACSMILVRMAVSKALKTSPDLICGETSENSSFLILSGNKNYGSFSWALLFRLDFYLVPSFLKHKLHQKLGLVTRTIIG